MVSLVLSTPFLYTLHFEGPSVLTIRKSLTPWYGSLTVNDSSTTVLSPVKLLDIKFLLISLNVLPNIAKYKASAIVDLPTPFRLSSLSLLMPVTMCNPFLNSTHTGVSPIDRKFCIFSSLNSTYFMKLYQ